MSIFMKEKNNFKSFLLTSDAIWKISSWSHDIPFFSGVFLPNHARTIPIRSSLEFIFTFIVSGSKSDLAELLEIELRIESKNKKIR